MILLFYLLQIININASMLLYHDRKWLITWGTCVHVYAAKSIEISCRLMFSEMKKHEGEAQWETTKSRLYTEPVQLTDTIKA